MSQESETCWAEPDMVSIQGRAWHRPARHRQLGGVNPFATRAGAVTT
jgi:hypothetical protein